jgi:signal transduction histidine kinase
MTRIRASAAGTDEVLLDVVARARIAGGADFAALILPTPDGRVRVAVADGLGADHFRGHVFDPLRSSMGMALVATQRSHTHDMTLWANGDFQNSYGYGPAVIAPLDATTANRGAVLMMRTAGHSPFAPAEIELASIFAAQVAVALDLNEARAEADRLRGLGDRHQIAHDLHDNVIQRLFAIGVGLQALLEQSLSEPTAERLRQHIADLDDTIDEIRSRIFWLQEDDERPTDLEERSS